jgi:hypothetical protein
MRLIRYPECEILEGQLRSGDRLPAEGELQKRFGVGRLAIREAPHNATEIRPCRNKQRDAGQGGITRGKARRFRNGTGSSADSFERRQAEAALGSTSFHGSWFGANAAKKTGTQDLKDLKTTGWRQVASFAKLDEVFCQGSVGRSK